MAVLALMIGCSAPAFAQGSLLGLPTSPLGDARAAEARNDPAEALARYLRVLAGNPRSIDALTGAGRAALDIDDPNAAVGFYARAEAIAPRDGRVKAGLGSALVRMEQPREALRLFDAARALGIYEASFAGDRGLAYDLIGDSRRAQADYALALRSRQDPENVRRMAASLGISGDREAALAALDPLLRQQDKAAWRTKAFVLALTGDGRGAAELVDILMPRTQASAMKPFLARLANLSAPQKALAVHFGHFPAAGLASGQVAYAEPLPVPGLAPSSAALMPAGTPFGRQGTPAASPPPATRPATRAERRLAARRGAPPIATNPQLQRTAPAPVPRPPVTAPVLARAEPAPQLAPRSSNVMAPVGTMMSPASTSFPSTASRPLSREAPAQVAAAPATTAAAVGGPPPVAARQPTPEPAFASLSNAAPAPKLAGVPVQSAPPAESPAPSRPAVASNVYGPVPLPEERRVAADTGATPASTPLSQAAADAAAAKRRAEIAAAVRAAANETGAVENPFKPGTPRQPARIQLAARDEAKEPAKAKDAAKPKDKAGKDAKPPKPKEASRHWVQIAGGANKALLPAEWKRLKAKNTALFDGKAAWTTPLKATNRLLVGPFKSASEAQAFVNEAGKAGLSTFSFTSAEGQAVEKLAAR